VHDPFLQGLAGELGNGLALAGGDGSGALPQGCGDPERDLRRGSRAGQGRLARGAAHLLDDVLGDLRGEPGATRQAQILLGQVGVRPQKPGTPLSLVR